MSWRGRDARVAAYRGKMHGRKSVQGLAVARHEFGELMGGELTRFDLAKCNNALADGSPWMKQRVAFKPTHCSRLLCAFCYIIGNAIPDRFANPGISRLSLLNPGINPGIESS